MEEKEKCPQSVAFYTLGCKVNSYETDAMEQLFREKGYEIVPFSEQASVYVVNTCTVTQVADQKSRQILHRARKKNPQGLIVACGCYVQDAGEKILASHTADLLVGNNEKSHIVELVEEKLRHASFTGAPEELKNPVPYETLTISGPGEKTRAYIKIQDGCNQFCSYCIIPFVRGRIRSRDMEDICREVEQLGKKGYREVVFTGIHLSSYGVDFGKQNALLEIIQRIAQIPGIIRIRLGSLEPGIITREFLLPLSKEEHFCPHFHLSLQSGCNATLKRMNRHYTGEEYAEKCALIREYFTYPSLTTDVIAGFPGETKEEFQETYDYLQKLSLSRMHIFPYSRREGTLADKMPNQVPEIIKKERAEALLHLEQNLRQEYEEKLVGEKTEILLEQREIIDGKAFYFGHNTRYVRIAIPEEALKEDERGQNHLVEKTVTGWLSPLQLKAE